VKPRNLLARTAAIAAFALLGSLPLASPAATPELKIPDFGHLRDKAVDSVDVTIDGLLLNIARKFAKESDDDELRILSDIKSVRVRNFTFDSDDAYSHADIDSVRRQLAAPGWSQLVSARKRDRKEDVDVYMCVENDRILGIAVVASDPRSFTIVNVIGSIDIDKLARLEGQFGIPKVDVEK
jgi:hypothetical protein